MTDLFSDREWFAVVARPGKSGEAHRQFERQGYGSFLPMCLRERTNRGKVEDVCRPLFGRYLFVGCWPDQSFSPIESTIGVSFVVRGVGHIPLRVSPLVLRRIKGRCDADGGVVDMRPRRPEPKPRLDWTPEQALEVIEGPFTSFVATLLELDKRHEIALVLVELFGREMRVGVPVDMLKPLSNRRDTA